VHLCGSNDGLGVFCSNPILPPPGVNIWKLSSLPLMTRPYKLEGLSSENLSSQALEFEGKARANPFGVPFRCPPWVSSWCYQQMLDWTGKWLPGTNTLAYSASSSAMKEKSFITLTPGINILKLSSLTMMQRQNKLERLPFMKYFLPRLRF